MNTEIELFFNTKNATLEAISKIIDYDLTKNPCDIVDCRKEDFTTHKDELTIYDDDDESYAYTISSSGAKGEELFMGELDGLVFIMSYVEDESYNTAVIRVFKKENNKAIIIE